MRRGNLTGSEEIELAVQKLLLGQSGEVIFSKRVPAGHVRRGGAHAALGRGHRVAGRSHPMGGRGQRYTLRRRGYAVCADGRVSTERNRTEVNTHRL